MTAAPHLFVRVAVRDERGTTYGVAADNLPPKWFTKDPNTSYRDDLRDMLAVIDAAGEHALAADAAPTVFELWQRIYRAQHAWAIDNGYPPLLWAFGASLIERAVIDAHCRALGIPFAVAVRANTLGIRLRHIHDVLPDREPAELLPTTPSSTIAIRHTVGLTDPLTDDEIPADDRIGDGLPQSLAASVDGYGVAFLKIKLSAQHPADLSRLRHIQQVISTRPRRWWCTLDGNEQFPDMQSFAEFWRAFEHEPDLSDLRRRVLFVEQPVHRDRALQSTVGDTLTDWHGAPPLIIDESGAGPAAVTRALELGYSGTSHKNCKGVFIGIANACLLTHLAQIQGTQLVLSGEDLTNIGPIALHQDLAVMATLGLRHVERNGQHYFRGTSAFPGSATNYLLRHHNDLYERHSAGFATMRIEQGRIHVDSVNAAPFGSAYLPDPGDFTDIDVSEYS